MVIKIWYTRRAKKHDECCEAMHTRDHDTEEKLSSSVGLNGNLILFMIMPKFHHENAQFHDTASKCAKADSSTASKVQQLTIKGTGRIWVPDACV